jgi:hypothetical protein
MLYVLAGMVDVYVGDVGAGQERGQISAYRGGDITGFDLAKCLSAKGSWYQSDLGNDPAVRMICSHGVQSSGITRKKLSVLLHRAAIHQIV